LEEFPVAFNRARTETAFELLPEGTLLAVVRALIDIGTQQTKNFDGKEKDGDAEETRDLETAVAVLETITHRVAATGKPFEVAVRINTESLDDRSTQRRLAEATGTYKKPFDITQMLGRALQIKVKHKDSDGKKYANVVDFVPLGEGQQALVKPPQRPLLLWEMEIGDLKDLDALPRLFGDKIGDLVKRSPEWKRRIAGPQAPPKQAPNPTAAPPNNGAGTPPQPPPRKTKAPAPAPMPNAGVRLWVYPEGEGEALDMSVEEARQYCLAKKLKPAEVEVRLHSTPDKEETLADFIGVDAEVPY
jgi:hypothetical protein